MRRAFIWLSVVIGIVLFGVLMFTADWTGALVLLERANPEYLALYIGATILILFLSAVRWNVIARSKGIDISIGLSCSYRLARFAVSFITPGPRVGGDAVGAALVTRHSNGRRKVSYGEALSTMVIDRMVELQTFAFLFFVWVIALALLGGIPPALKVLLVTLSSLLLLLMLTLGLGAMRGNIMITKVLRRLAKKSSTINEIDRFETTLTAFYRKQPRDFFLAHLIAGVAWLVSLVEYYAILKVLGFDVPLYGIFVIYSFVGLAYALPVPLAIGTLETAQATAFSIIGLPPVGGILLAFVTRMRDLTISAVGFIILAYHGILPYSK